MKKLTSLLLIICLVLSLSGLAACRHTGKQQPSGTSGTPSSVETEDTPESESLYDTQIPLVIVTDDTQDTAVPDDTETAPSTGTEADTAEIEDTADTPEETEPPIDEFGTYDDKDNVALYIHTYGKLPSNYITKNEASDLGWTGGSVEQVAKGKAIGGDRFGNYEGKLPKAKGRVYYECDIDTIGRKSRGAKRIIYSNDGLIYYTEDHYETFELLYTGESD